MSKWLVVLSILVAVALFQTAYCEIDPLDDLSQRSIELAALFRSSPAAMARFRELFGEGSTADVGRLSNLQRLG
ncbi:unnamed protein product [Nippostrongylus brasiliensis]|uniref:Neuropeptide F n=1 Tax=Nippostrongylus brasiliensis TaxID=27835 RepID=A0A0N4Y851_NIPBR|nr:unnamed protein product [Nippostrongylus brasiliensis]